MKLIPAALIALLLAPFLAMPAAARKKEVPPPPPPPAAPLSTSVDGLPIGALPKQDLGSGQCAAFLWTRTPARALVAMISANPALFRYAPAGVVTDLARTTMVGDAKFGLSPQASYASSDTSIAVDLTIEERGDLKDGAAVPAGTISITQSGADTLIVPVAGIIGCG